MKFEQFVPLSQVLTDFSETERLLEKYGEVVIVMDDRPKYRISTLKSNSEVLHKTIPNSPNIAENKGTDTIEILNKIGKSTFIEHYYDFKNDNDPVNKLPDDFSRNSKRSRTSKARRIFREGLQFEALQIIMTSNRLDQETINKAKEIYEKEISQS